MIFLNFVYLNVSANQTQPLKRKAKASNETSALIIIDIDYNLQPTTVTLLYSQLLYLTVSLLTVWWKCHAPRHYRFKLCFSWIRTPLGQDGQQIEQIPIDIKLISFCCFDDAHKIDLLIIDELSYLTFNRYQSEMLFQIISERSERASVIISTNLEFSEWTQLFENEMMLAALIDRVTFRSFVLNMNCNSSYRIDSTVNNT